VKWAWVVFDVGMASGLFALAGRWRKGLATGLAVLATGDAALTLWQAVRFNGPRAHGWAWPVIVAGVLAPAGASAFLWHARGRYRQLPEQVDLAASEDPEDELGRGQKPAPT
jgi:hypothetical protein